MYRTDTIIEVSKIWITQSIQITESSGALGEVKSFQKLVQLQSPSCHKYALYRTALLLHAR